MHKPYPQNAIDSFFVRHIAKALLLACVALMGGCVVSHSNLTPEEVPYYPADPADALDRIRSDAQMESVQDGDHAIWVDIGKKLFTRRNSIEAFVIIEGNEIPMKEIDTARIIYEHELPVCGGSADYSLRTKNQSVFGSRVFMKTSGPYDVSVPMAGSWAWWSPVNSRPSDDNFEMNLVGLEANEVIVRNYGDASLTVLTINISAQGLRGFTIIDKPELPRSLACGESLAFKVRWNEDPRVPNDLGTLQMQFARGAPSPQSRVITLNAVPGPG